MEDIMLKIILINHKNIVEPMTHKLSDNCEKTQTLKQRFRFSLLLEFWLSQELVLMWACKAN